MRSIISLTLAYVFSGCLGCMKDLQPTPTYEGGSIIKIRKYLWGGSITVEDKTNNQWKLDGMVFDPQTKTFKLDHAERSASASEPMDAFVAQQAQVVAGMAWQVEQSKIQMQTTDMVLGHLVTMTNGVLAAVPGMMQLRNERAAIHNAAPPDILDQLVQQYLPQIVGSAAMMGGYNADLGQLKADQFVALARAKQLQAKYPDDPSIANLVQTQEAALSRCCQFNQRPDPLAVPGLP